MDKTLFRTNGKPLRIALIGGARTGKDTIATYLRSKATFKRLAFGDAMKRRLYATFTDLPKEPKPRKAMIQFAQACREIDPDVWVKHLEQELRVLEAMKYQNFVITDVRQANEIKFCRDNGFIIVKVEAPQEVQVERASAGGEDLDTNNVLDAYALTIKDYDYKIINDGSLLDLYNKIDNLLNS